MSSATALQTGNPALGTVSRQPQTSQSPDVKGAPFIRLSRQATVPLVTVTGTALGNPITPQLKPVGGYHRRWRLEVSGVGGVAGGTSAVAATDLAYPIISSILVRDPFNQPIINLDGYSLYLADLYGSQFGQLGSGNNLAGLPSYSAIATSGNFFIPFYIPFELDSSGYCSLPGLSAASLPSIAINYAAGSAIFSTAPGGTQPTITTRILSDFWAAPVDNAQLGPPDVGSSAQWSLGVAAQSIPSAANQRTTLQRVGTFIHTLVLVLRDSTGARIDQFPSTDLTLWVDGVPIEQETTNSRYDKMFARTATTRPTGVIAYQFRNSVQEFPSGADTHDTMLYTTPATSLEIGGVWGTISNASATVQVVTGELYPVSGVPYTHLAS